MQDIDIISLSASCNYDLDYFIKLLRQFGLKRKKSLSQNDLIIIRSFLVRCKNLTYKRKVLLFRIDLLLSEN
jgi:translation initiation factor 2 gamma subunit (eIF-2gamma)